MKYTTKTHVQLLVNLCAAHGIRYVVISPGSRNASATIAFNQDDRFECLCIRDERVAGFFALGMAQQLHEPVLLLCTSGSAPLNYAPALVEAYYQRIPLIALTADRPKAWIDQGDGQTIRQFNVFEQYIRKFVQLEEASDELNNWHNERLINEAINSTQHPVAGPVHINIPLQEPLYETLDEPTVADSKVIRVVRPESQLSENQLLELQDIWNSSGKKMVLAGLSSVDQTFNSVLAEQADQDDSFVVLTEATSNLKGKIFHACIDRLLAGMHAEEETEFAPELLITVGTAIVSKRIKSYLRKHRPKHHWHLDVSGEHTDTYQALTHLLPLSAADLFSQLDLSASLNSNYKAKWNQLEHHTTQRHETFLGETPWSDLQAYAILAQHIPADSNLQMGNSAVVRYLHLFDNHSAQLYNANRGTSGIDGCTSTATGAAFVNQKPTVLISGDVSFMYDSNALWNDYLAPNLRIIVVNNSGGGIFRYIPGPSGTSEFETFFEAKQEAPIEPLAQAFNLAYVKVKSASELTAVLPNFLSVDTNGTAKILEVQTPREENDRVLKAYFQALGQ